MSTRPQHFEVGIPILIAEPMDDGVHDGPFEESGYYIVFASTAARLDRRRR
jgi:hypothetical protein